MSEPFWPQKEFLLSALDAELPEALRQMFCTHPMFEPGVLVSSSDTRASVMFSTSQDNELLIACPSQEYPGQSCKLDEACDRARECLARQGVDETNKVILRARRLRYVIEVGKD